MTTKALSCPQCEEADSVRRSRSRWYDYPLRIVGLRAWRCLQCNTRFYGRKPADAEPGGHPPS